VEPERFAVVAPTPEPAAFAELREARANVNPRLGAEQLAARRIDLQAAVAAADLVPPWRCDRLAADGYLTVLAGRGGDGKSLLALALAGGVQNGNSVAGLPCRAGRVAIFDAENGAPLIGRRLKQAATPLDRLTVYDAAGIDVHRDRDAIDHAIRNDQAELVIFDSLRTLAPRAKENDSDAMAPIMGTLRQLARDTGAAVLLVHHRDKALEHDFRGSGAIHDQADLMFVLERGEKDNRWLRRLRCAKCRIDAEPEDRWIAIEPRRDSLVLVEATAPKRRQRRADVQDQVCDDALSAVREADEALSGAEIARRLHRPKSDNTVRRAVKKLERAGLLIRQGDSGWGLPPGETATPLPATIETAGPTGELAVAAALNGNRGNPRLEGCHGAPPPKGGANGNPGDARTGDGLGALADRRGEGR
jgi:biotin operon repressor